MHRPVRRILAGNDISGKCVVLSDAPASDVWLDPARPGFASTMVWVSDRTPAPVAGIREAPRFGQRLAPPPNGSLCRFVEFPPEPRDARAAPAQVAAYFAAMGAPEAAVAGPHPYMQRTPSLDFCYILEGEITLVLETGEVDLKAGDVLVQNGAAHAFSNRSQARCVIILSQHDARPEKASSAAGLAAERAAPPPPSDSRKPIRRVVTGTNAQGRSCVVHDSLVPNTFPRSSGSWFYEVWTFDAVPVPLDSAADGGDPSRPFSLSPPELGAHWRISFLPPAEKATTGVVDSKNEGRGTQRREGGSHPGMHRTPTLDYAICFEGERVLVLEDGQVTLGKGDVVIQLGSWHTWARGANVPSMMSYVMIGGEFG